MQCISKVYYIFFVQVADTVSVIAQLGTQTTASGIKNSVNSASSRYIGSSEYENAVDYAYNTVFPVKTSIVLILYNFI